MAQQKGIGLGCRYSSRNMQKCRGNSCSMKGRRPGHSSRASWQSPRETGYPSQGRCLADGAACGSECPWRSVQGLPEGSRVSGAGGLPCTRQWAQTPPSVFKKIFFVD